MSPVDDLDGPPAAVALVQEGVVASGELILLPEGAKGEQTLQALIEVAKDGGQGQTVQPLQLPRGCNVVHLSAHSNIAFSLGVDVSGTLACNAPGGGGRATAGYKQGDWTGVCYQAEGVAGFCDCHCDQKHECHCDQKHSLNMRTLVGAAMLGLVLDLQSC